MAQQSHIVAEDTSKLGKAKKLLGEDRSCKNAFWQDTPPNTNIPSSSLPVWTKIFNKTCSQLRSVRLEKCINYDSEKYVASEKSS